MLGAIATGGALALAGCGDGGGGGGDDGGSGDDGDDGDGGDTGDDGGGSSGSDGGNGGSGGGSGGGDYSIGSRCQVDFTASEVAVVGCQSEADQGDLLVSTVVRNESQETVNVFDYRYDIRAYEENEADLEYDITANRNTQFPEGRDVEPGETVPVTHRIGLDESKTPEDVVLYTINMSKR